MQLDDLGKDKQTVADQKILGKSGHSPD